VPVDAVEGPALATAAAPCRSLFGLGPQFVRRLGYRWPTSAFRGLHVHSVRRPWPGSTWSIFLLAGKPGYDAGARYHRATSEQGWLSCPDNIAFDSKGRIWIVTDGAPEAAGVADGVYGADTMGHGRALTRCFYQAPTAAEVCGPIFTPDDQTFFLAVQHPGDGSTFDKPSTRWPDFEDGMPPRPAVVAITKKGGGTVGS
jgi:hypothetical protein